MAQSDVSPDVLASKLGDSSVLRNYCEFACLYRPSIVNVLIASLDDNAVTRRAIAMKVAALYVAALEDLVLWFFALKRWRPGSELLFDVIDSVFVNESDRSSHSSKTALTEIASLESEELRSQLGLPPDGWLVEHGWSQEELAEHKEGIAALKEFVQEALSQRTTDEGVLVTSYNKIKHGALALATTENSGLGISVMLASRRGPQDPASGRRKINTGWIACDDDDVRHVASSVLVVSHVTWALLNLVHLYRFDPNWAAPEWPFPSKF
jgi:hypothetical protein